MGRYSRDADEIRQDIRLCQIHPEYEDVPLIDALQDLKRRRREGDVDL